MHLKYHSLICNISSTKETEFYFRITVHSYFRNTSDSYELKMVSFLRPSYYQCFDTFFSPPIVNLPHLSYPNRWQPVEILLFLSLLPLIKKLFFDLMAIVTESLLLIGSYHNWVLYAIFKSYNTLGHILLLFFFNLLKDVFLYQKISIWYH